VNKKKIVELVMNDIVLFYQRYFDIPDLCKTVKILNTGQCYVVAHLAGQVLKQVYQLKPRLYSHCLHAWLEVDGIAYDTLYPQGYQTSVATVWKLHELGYNLDEMEIGDYGGNGYVPQGYDFQGFYKAFLARWGIEATEIVPDAVCVVQHVVKSASVRKRLKRWHRRKSAKYVSTPLFVKHRHINAGALPFTHYY